MYPENTYDGQEVDIPRGWSIGFVKKCEAACDAVWKTDETARDVYLELPLKAVGAQTVKTMVKTDIPIFLTTWCA